jgi:hypothetical protein
MPTLDQVNQQIAAYGHAYIFWTNKEIRYLPKVLDTNETIKAVTSGMVNGKTWLAVCTDRRLLFINCNMFIGMEEIQMPLDRVQSIDHQFSLFFGSIKVFDGVDVFTLNMVLKASILPFVKATQAAMYAIRHPASSNPAPAAHPTDVASQLAKLADLKEKGYLTDAEFAEQKKKLLGH